MDFNKIKEEYYYIDGSLRDIISDGIVRKKDIMLLLDFLYKRYDVSFFDNGEKKYLNNTNDIDFNDGHWYFLKFNLEGVEMQMLFAENYFEFVFSPYDINSIEKHNMLVSFMKDISSLLKVNLRLCEENSHDKKYTLFEIY